MGTLFAFVHLPAVEIDLYREIIILIFVINVRIPLLSIIAQRNFDTVHFSVSLVENKIPITFVNNKTSRKPGHF